MSLIFFRYDFWSSLRVLRLLLLMKRFFVVLKLIDFLWMGWSVLVMGVFVVKSVLCFFG